MQTQMPVDSLGVPRFVGVPTFMRLPYVRDVGDADVAVFGMPSDCGGPYRTGARFGPNAIRAQSIMLRPINPYQGNVNVFERLRVVDAGDSPVVPGYLLRSMDHIERTTARLAEAGAVPLGLGGDHSVSLPELRALARVHGPLALVHFDAHTDTWDSYFDGERYSAGTPFRRAVEEGLVVPERSIQIGMRGSLFRESDISQSLELGYQVVTTDEAIALGPDGLGQRVRERVAGQRVFFSFDLDVVDPASAPGVQTPEAGGPTAREILSMIRALTGFEIVGADVVETNPLYDGPGQVTALLAATVAAEVLALIALRR
ncbi:MAG: agmatinase [Ectothiorhodospiraceae bacterium]|nr:agmatinase [Chromatiales bacterium]MCP5154237.1 agmatinase [Ectothiorhodospiraceae bacterium]